MPAGPECRELAATHVAVRGGRETARVIVHARAGRPEVTLRQGAVTFHLILTPDQARELAEGLLVGARVSDRTATGR